MCVCGGGGGVGCGEGAHVWKSILRLILFINSTCKTGSYPGLTKGVVNWQGGGGVTRAIGAVSTEN